ncbi:D-alanyl-lipoteichoic acid biosynthesis protein DltD [Paenibacillus medicaginis]|uniref:D-alanyl-lipoteichoic acid biosynthesis protein DltD n=1 Tax=Paenibacillus medicaginis TaxID=1470560 RepID=A0ABV5CB59_9BACL
MEKAINDKGVEVVITGMSYSLKGVITDLLTRKSAKLCWASQDIYYNYAITKRALDHNDSFKYCIIGMAYYTFDIDLSKLKNQSYLIDKIYYPLLNDSHHYTPSETYERQRGIEGIEQIIDMPYPFTSLQLMKSFTSAIGILQGDELIDSIWNKCDNVPLEWLGKKRAFLHGRHDYPETRKENIEIFKALLTLLKNNNIKPFIIIFPTSKLYQPFHNPETKKRFYEIVNSFKSEFDFALYDYFDSELFEQSDFADADHLNKKGAYKMTNIINEAIFKSL